MRLNCWTSMELLILLFSFSPFLRLTPPRERSILYRLLVLLVAIATPLPYTFQPYDASYPSSNLRRKVASSEKWKRETRNNLVEDVRKTKLP